MATKVRSFSKINLGLRIGPLRPEGYHALATVYQTLALHDVVTVQAVRAATTRIAIRTEHPRVPVDRRNTAWVMVERALAAMGVAAEVEIGIDKRLPVQGGLGAGSANAAAALLGLERELGLEPGVEPSSSASGTGTGRVLEGAERLRLAAGVGSDVPLFLVGGAVLGLGRGELVAPLPDLAFGSGAAACVVAVPRVGVSTPAAFREWDRVVAREEIPGLTPATEATRLEELSLACASAYSLLDRGGVRSASGIDPAESTEATGRVGTPEEPRVAGRFDRAENTLLSLVRTGIENDFEQVVFPFHPSLREIKRTLLGQQTGQPALYAAMSGSGSAIFGLYRSVDAAKAAQQRVQASGTEALVTEMLPRGGYWERMYL